MSIKYKRITIRSKEDILKYAETELGFISPTVDVKQTIFPTGWINVYDQNNRRLYGHWLSSNQDGTYTYDVAELEIQREV